MSNTDDRLAIQDLASLYATALDSRDFARLGQVFTPGCSVQYPGAPLLEGVDAVAAYCERALSRFSVTQHLLGNYQAAINGDRATASTYLHAAHVEPQDAGGGLFILAGIYRDALVRTPEGWRIAERTLESWWTRRTAGDEPR